MRVEVLLLAASTVVQLAAAALALRVGIQTGKRRAWGLIAAAIVLMAVRRITSLEGLLHQPGASASWVAEAIALAISALMLAGVASVAPILRAFRVAHQEADQLGRILDESLNEIFLFDAETLRFVRVNRGARENLGYSMEELRTRTPLDLKPEFDRERFEALLAPLRTGARRSVRFATVHRRQDGSRYPVEVNLQLSRIGERSVFVAIILDVSERQRAEEARRLLEAAVKQAGEGIVLCDRRGRIEFANRAFCEMMALAPERAVGTSVAALSFGADDDRLIAEIGAKLARGEPWHGRYESTWRDGTRHARDGSIAPVRGEGGRIEHVVGLLRDVTREMQLERDLLHAQKMEAIGRLAGGVAHDFNNLLTVIGGYVDALAARLAPGSEERESALQIQAAADRAAELTRQLLSFGRKTAVRARRVDVNELIAGVSGMLERLIGEDVRLERRLTPAIGWVEVDPGQLEHALLNLAANARDAMPGGGRLGIETAETTVGPADGRDVPHGRWIVLSVTDTGTGLDVETASRIFDPFFTTKEPGHGTGLGLSAVYGIVRSAGGTIRVESKPGQGTRFELWLPRVEPEAAAAEAPSGAAEVRPGAESILLVEDEPAVRRIAQRTLERLGYRVRAACDGLEALALVEREAAPDLVVTDIVMPGMSGFELVARLRELHPGLRVVTMSGYADRSARQGEGAPGTIALLKPFAPADLARAVRSALDAA